MAPTLLYADRSNSHPVQKILLAGMLPLFAGALLSDIAYSQTYETQWINFSSWLIAGGLLFCGLSLLWAFVDLLRVDRRGPRSWLFAALLLVTFVTGFIGALIHARDAWASMPDGLIVSALVALLAVAAVWTGFSAGHEGSTA